ncbi:MAG: hypothetical protein ABSG24_11345 [Acidimicrobiales bacterium]
MMTFILTGAELWNVVAFVVKVARRAEGAQLEIRGWLFAAAVVTFRVVVAPRSNPDPRNTVTKARVLFMVVAAPPMRGSLSEEAWPLGVDEP